VGGGLASAGDEGVHERAGVRLIAVGVVGDMLNGTAKDL
jgi:hypothetical protein